MDRFRAYRLGAGRAMPTNPLLRAVYAIAGLGVLGVMLVLGTVFFVAFAGIALVGGLVVGARIWWLSRKAERTLTEAFGDLNHGGPNPDAPPRQQATDSNTVIEGEYIIVDKHDREA